MANLQITLDDGPQPVGNALTPILAELGRRGVVAAFFNLGEEVAADAAAARSILQKGHVLCNHSWDHLMPSTTKYSDAEVLEQFQKTHDEVLRATRVAMKHWRAPRLEQISRLKALLTTGPKAIYTLSHCDVHADSKDSQGATDAAGMLKALRADIAAGSGRGVFRLLFHVKAATANALPAVLDGLLADKHTLVDFAQTT